MAKNTFRRKRDSIQRRLCDERREEKKSCESHETSRGKAVRVRRKALEWVVFLCVGRETKRGKREKNMVSWLELNNI